MRILIIVDCYYPSTKSSAKLIHDLGVELVRRGNRVSVLTPSESISEDLVTSIDDGILVARVKTGKIKGAHNAVRALGEARLSANLWRKAKSFFHENQCDLIIFYSPSIFFGPLVRRLKALWGCPSYLILRDIFPEWAVNAGVLRKRFVYRFFRGMEAYQYEAADLIAVQSPANLDYFAREFPRKQFRLKVLYNWTALHEPDLPATNYRSQLGLEDKVVFFYGGNIGVAQDMDNVLRLAARVSFRTDIHFLLVGSGSEVVRLNRDIAARGLDNIQILPSVAQREYLSMVSEFDAGLISLDARIKSHNIPGKLLSYAYWGMPVLASINPGNDLFNLIEKNRAGFCFANGDDENLALAVRRLADDRDLRSEMGANSRCLLEHVFSVELAADRIFADLQDTGFSSRSSSSFEPIKAGRQARPSELLKEV